MLDELSDADDDQPIAQSVFKVIEDNFSDYEKEMKNERAEKKKFVGRVRDKLTPVERIKFDTDDEFARETVHSARSNKEVDSGDDRKVKEPERDFDKLKAKI